MRKVSLKLRRAGAAMLCIVTMLVLSNPIVPVIKSSAAPVISNNQKHVQPKSTGVEVTGGQTQKTAEVRKFDQNAMPARGDEIAVIKTKLGTIKIRLLSEVAPKAVEIFKNRINSGYYDNQSFNRIIGNSMVQGGSSVLNTSISSNTNFNLDEYNPDVRNYRGAVSIASGDPGSIDQFVVVQAGPEKIEKDTLSFMKNATESQFPKQVINKYQKYGGAPWLDFHNVIFGQVFSGMDIIDKIAKAELDENNMIKKAVKINKVTIEVFKK